jgi:hypothetical protein
MSCRNLSSVLLISGLTDEIVSFALRSAADTKRNLPSNTQHSLHIFQQQAFRSLEVRDQADTLDRRETFQHIIVFRVIRDIGDARPANATLAFALACPERRLALLEILRELSKDELEDVLEEASTCQSGH